ncbi:MAG: RNA-binding S4 domain-containing protein [Pyrinomonadaceae bacterium]
MRLDLFLKVSRLIIRRSLAQEFCDAGMISVNGKTAKSSKEIHQGDEIEIKRPNRETKIRVAEVPPKKQVSRNEAVELYEVISENIIRDEMLDY